MFRDLYTGDAYLQRNPSWHLPESPWKAEQILRMLAKQRLSPRTVCEAGCGAGEILRLLQEGLPEDAELWGYEISPHAYTMARARENARLHFKLADIQRETDVAFDLMLLIDIVEHLEDYFSFLRTIHPLSRYTIFHFPLDITLRSVARGHLVDYRQRYGHIHYFTKELALQTLRDLGYTVLDWFYTKEPVIFPPDDPTASQRDRRKAHRGQSLWKLRKAPSQLCFAVNPDLAARVFGDCRLLVLAE